MEILDRKSICRYICFKLDINYIEEEELARRIGVSDTSINKWLHQYKLPKIKNLCVLANMFGITIDQLLNCEITSDDWKRASFRIFDAFDQQYHLDIKKVKNPVNFLNLYIDGKNDLYRLMSTYIEKGYGDIDMVNFLSRYYDVTFDKDVYMLIENHFYKGMKHHSPIYDLTADYKINIPQCLEIINELKEEGENIRADCFNIDIKDVLCMISLQDIDTLKSVLKCCVLTEEDLSNLLIKAESIEDNEMYIKEILYRKYLMNLI